MLINIWEKQKIYPKERKSLLWRKKVDGETKFSISLVTEKRSVATIIAAISSNYLFNIVKKRNNQRSNGILLGWSPVLWRQAYLTQNKERKQETIFDNSNGTNLA